MALTRKLASTLPAPPLRHIPDECVRDYDDGYPAGLSASFVMCHDVTKATQTAQPDNRPVDQEVSDPHKTKEPDTAQG
jgi:hypothetical protein